MRFQVPQYIDIEDKLFGPFSFKQFIYLLGGAGAGVALWIIIPWKVIAIFFAVPIIALAVALAFLKPNNKPFIFMLESALYYFIKKKMYLWQKKPKKVVKTEHSYEIPVSTAPAMVGSKLKDLTWNLDVAAGTPDQARQNDQLQQEIQQTSKSIADDKAKSDEPPTIKMGATGPIVG